MHARSALVCGSSDLRILGCDSLLSVHTPLARPNVASPLLTHLSRPHTHPSLCPSGRAARHRRAARGGEAAILSLRLALRPSLRLSLRFLHALLPAFPAHGVLFVHSHFPAFSYFRSLGLTSSRFPRFLAFSLAFCSSSHFLAFPLTSPHLSLEAEQAHTHPCCSYGCACLLLFIGVCVCVPDVRPCFHQYSLTVQCLQDSKREGTAAEKKEVSITCPA